jgi:hypothetical protein
VEARDEGSQLFEIVEEQARRNGGQPSRQDVRHQQDPSSLEGSPGLTLRV